MSPPVYFEMGSKKVFASALDWPGWCRSGRDEAAALAALLAAAPRYARVAALAGIDLKFPASISDFDIRERLPGGSAVDFGVPEMAPSGDDRAYTGDELRQSRALLRACWQVFDGAKQAAQGKELRKGPRGGGRDLASIARHVSEAQVGYLSALGHKVRIEEEDDTPEREERIRQEVLLGLENANRGDYPSTGPRGGKRWFARYFVRRVAWHILDHAWEIEDRL